LPLLWQYLAHRKLHDPTAAPTLNRQMSQVATEKWPAPITRGFADYRAPEVVLAADQNTQSAL